MPGLSINFSGLHNNYAALQLNCATKQQETQQHSHTLHADATALAPLRPLHQTHQPPRQTHQPPLRQTHQTPRCQTLTRSCPSHHTAAAAVSKRQAGSQRVPVRGMSSSHDMRVCVVSQYMQSTFYQHLLTAQRRSLNAISSLPIVRCSADSAVPVPSLQLSMPLDKMHLLCCAGRYPPQTLAPR